MVGNDSRGHRLDCLGHGRPAPVVHALPVGALVDGLGPVGGEDRHAGPAEAAVLDELEGDPRLAGARAAAQDHSAPRFRLAGQDLSAHFAEHPRTPPEELRVRLLLLRHLEEERLQRQNGRPELGEPDWKQSIRRLPLGESSSQLTFRINGPQNGAGTCGPAYQGLPFAEWLVVVLAVCWKTPLKPSDATQSLRWLTAQRVAARRRETGPG